MNPPGYIPDGPMVPEADSVDFDIDLVRDAVLENSATKYLLKLAKAGKILFCPCSEVDWQPMTRMTDLVRAFIFCGRLGGQEPFLHLQATDCLTALGNPFCFDGGGKVCHEALRELGLTDVIEGGSYCWIKRRIRSDGLVIERLLLVAFLEGDPSEVYGRLFQAPNPGPRILCAHQSDWDGSAIKAAVFRAEVSKPEVLVAKAGGLYPPWIKGLQTYSDWKGVSAYRTHHALPIPILEPRQFPNCHVSTEPLCTEMVHGGTAVHLTREQYMEFDFDPNITVLVDTDDSAVVAALQATDPMVRPLKLTGLRLEDALVALKEALASTNCDTVSTGRLGLEDEATFIGEMWEAMGVRQYMVVHTESETDNRALRGFQCDDLDPMPLGFMA